MVSESERYVLRGGIGGVKLDMVSRLAPQADQDENDRQKHLKVEGKWLLDWDEKLTREDDVKRILNKSLVRI